MDLHHSRSKMASKAYTPRAQNGKTSLCLPWAYQVDGHLANWIKAMDEKFSQIKRKI